MNTLPDFDTEVDYVSALVINPDGMMPLSLQAANQQWSLPKGPIQEGENELDALHREFTGETGIAPTRLEVVRRIGDISRYSSYRGQDFTVAYYIGTTLARRDLRPRGRDIVTAEWVSPEEAQKRLLNVADTNIVIDAREELYALAGRIGYQA